MECCSNVLICTTSLLQCPVPPTRMIAEVGQVVPGIYGWLGLCGGYALVMLFAPVRRALVDGLHCLRRYQRIWVTFAVLGFGYFVFQFVTFTPIRHWADLALRKGYGICGYLVYLILLLSALASLLKPIVFWRLPEWTRLMPAASLLRMSATVHATGVIFRYNE